MRQTLTEEYLKTLTKWNVLALDTASRTGYYSCHGYGTVYFPPTDKAPKKYGDDYEQHKAFRTWVKEFIQEHNIKLVCAEDVNVGTKFMALRKLAQFQGVLFEICATLNVPLIVFNVTAIKRFACNKGNATKEEMMQAAIQKHHLDCEGDDNAADACHIFNYAIKRYNISTK